MQAWWESYHNGQWQLRNSLHVPVAFKDAHYTISCIEYVLPPDLTIEQTKQLVAGKFAVMLIEQATAVLTIGA